VTHGSSPDGDVGTLDLINNELTARLARQTDAGKGIDTKAGILATFAAVAAQFLATRHTQPVLAVIAYVAYAVAFGLAVWGLAVTDLKDVPKPRHLVEMYAREEKDKVLRPLIVKRVDGLESNQRMYKAKAKRWQYSLVALAVGVALSVLAMVHTEDRAQEPGERQPTPAGSVSMTPTGNGTPTPSISQSPTHS
jgi:hypothetical protein